MPLSTSVLIHWGRVTHICVSNLTIIGSDNGLSPGRGQAITWTNIGILLIGPLGTNFNEMLIKIHTFSFKKIHLKMSFGKWRPFCLHLNVLILVTTSVYFSFSRQIPIIHGKFLAAPANTRWPTRDYTKWSTVPNIKYRSHPARICIEKVVVCLVTRQPQESKYQSKYLDVIVIWRQTFMNIRVVLPSWYYALDGIH